MKDEHNLTNIVFNFADNYSIELIAFVSRGKSPLNDRLIRDELSCLRALVANHVPGECPPQGLTNGEYFTIYQDRARAYKILDTLDSIEKYVNAKNNDNKKKYEN